LSDLEEAGLTPAEKRTALEKVAAQYAVAITPAMVELIDRADPNDPMARQFVPDTAELETRPEERADPIGDDVHSPVEGVVHRYPDRALLQAHACLRGVLPLLLPPRDDRPRRRTADAEANR